MFKRITSRQVILVAILMAGLSANLALAQGMAKAQVGSLIKKVEDGVDDFRDCLEKKGENNRSSAASPEGQSRTKRAQPTDTQKNNAKARKDALDDSLGDLNKTTNKLRWKFDATDTWATKKGEVQGVVDDARKVNQSLTKGNYGTESARYWGVPRNAINDLARAYAITPLGV